MRSAGWMVPPTPLPTSAVPAPAPRRRPRLSVVAAGLAVMAGAGATLIVDAGRSSGVPVALSGPAAASPGGDPAGDPTAAAPGTAPSAAPSPAAIAAISPAAPSPAAAPPGAPPPAPPPGATARATPARAAAPAPPPDPAARLQQVEAIADTSGWDWRTVHVHFRIGFDPAACCHWGVYDAGDHKTIWIGPTAFGDDTRLRYVVLHELSHAWQWHTHRLNKLEADMGPWGYAGVDALEAGADCIAADWGASPAMGHYWACPPDARALMARRLAGQWK